MNNKIQPSTNMNNICFVTLVKVSAWKKKNSRLLLKERIERHLHSLHKICSWLIQVTIIQIKCQGMTNEIDCIIL